LTVRNRCASIVTLKSRIDRLTLNEPHPQHLYKYRSLDTAKQIQWLERTLIHSELYFPTADQFNDPFDCCPVSPPISPKDVRNWIRRRPNISGYARRRSMHTVPTTPEGVARMQDRVISGITKEVGIYSLSAKCDHVLMWSHYASSHTGICLRFRVDPEFQFFATAKKVHYQDKRPTINVFIEDSNTRVKKSILTKADFWSYEEEWRIFNYTQGPGVRKFPGNLLDGVILGARISPANEEIVLKMIADRQPKTEIMRAAVHPDLFRLDISPALIQGDLVKTG
jgi:DUF2971 family protein